MRTPLSQDFITCSWPVYVSDSRLYKYPHVTCLRHGFVKLSGQQGPNVLCFFMSGFYMTTAWGKPYFKNKMSIVCLVSLTSLMLYGDKHAGSLRIKRRPEASATKNWAGPAGFPFGPASFSSFSCLKIFKDEFRAGKFWNRNAKTVLVCNL